jgi:hypothetical protein
MIQVCHDRQLFRDSLIVHLAELLFQSGGQTFKALSRGVIGLPCELPGFKDFHFQFDALVFVGHGNRPAKVQHCLDNA